MQSLSLAGSHWQFRDSSGKTWLPATVPGCVHTDLLRAGKIPDPFRGDNEKDLQWIEERDWEYRVFFDVAENLLADESVDLVADGLDTVATVTLNGVEIARTENMFTGWRRDVKRHLRAGRNELRTRFGSAMRYIRENRTEHAPREINDPVGGCTRIRKQQCQFGWDWGPRLVTAGIWRDIRLEAWSGSRLETVRVAQTHKTNDDGSRQVTLTLAPELAQADPKAICRWRLSLDGKVITSGSGPVIVVAQPRLWWPNGHGAQPLYTLEVEVFGGAGGARDDDGRALIGTWTRRIGLRTVALDRTADAWGESFRFVVNGRAIFAKGANWIPAHAFVAGLGRADYARDLRAAALAHMNMIRVWGGGIYESEDFYDLCDELGLLVWQDFMFACTRYPGDDAFVAGVRDEAAYQLRRLRHRACLALWCGNNEIWAINAHELTQPGFAAQRAAYERVFHETLPALVAAHDGVTAYWPSSPWRAGPDTAHAAGEQRGDTHFWDVWHARSPVRDYEKHAFRFVSEFGMQSFSSPQTNATFAAPADRNVFGAAMRNHQKNRAGNQIILDYVSRLYRFPRGQDGLIYLSQLNQAHCMRTGVEHYRRAMPRCMGALYWQLNDCWPAASWSSIEFTGRWRALHHVARRFFAPMIASAHVPGDETATIGNYRATTVREAHLFTVSDNPMQTRGVLRWDLFHVGGRKLLSGKKNVVLRHGESVRRHTLDLAKPMAKHGRDNIYLRIALDVETEGESGGGAKRARGATGAFARVSEETVFLTPPCHVALPKDTAKTKITAKLLPSSPAKAALTIVSPVFQHRFAFEFENTGARGSALAGADCAASDNFFELYPNEPKTVTLTFAKPLTPARLAQLMKHLTHRSLADTYE